LRWETVWKTIAWKPPELFLTENIQQEFVEEQDSKAANEL
jgi:hypothetical protein